MRSISVSGIFVSVKYSHAFFACATSIERPLACGIWSASACKISAVRAGFLAKAVGIDRVRVVDPYNLKECEDVIREEVAADEPSVVISRRPCALLKYVKHNPPLKINKDKCVGCKMCMKIGCPAISMRDGKSEIDFTQCVGCNVCSQLCKFDAIEEGK